MTDIPREIIEQFRDGFDSEPELVKAIKSYLRTSTQRTTLAAHDITIEDVLNGRVEGGNPLDVHDMLTA